MHKTRILYNLKNEEILAFMTVQMNLDYFAKWNKPDIEGQTWHESTYIDV